MKSRIFVSAIAVIFAGCGGGGDDSLGLVSSNPLTPAPAGSLAAMAGQPTPVNPPPANEPVESSVKPPAGPPASPPPPPADQILTIPGTTLIKALGTSGYVRSMSSAELTDNFFSETEIGFGSTGFKHRSSFVALETPFGGTSDPPLPRKETGMTLDVAFSPDGPSFAGTGTIRFEGIFHSLQGPQYTIPDQVPLNTAGLVEWKVPGPDYWVRFNVGTVTGQPEQFRACFDILLPGLDRVSCTHHKRDDGTPVGADSIERIAGVETVHETNDESESPRQVLFCNLQEFGRLVPPGTESFFYSLFQFKHPYLYQNRSLILDLTPGTGPTTTVQTDLGGGLILETVGTPRGTYTFTHRANVVETWAQSFGVAEESYRKNCQSFGSRSWPAP